MKALGIITASVLTVVISWLWVGYVVTILWGWFIVTTFGLPAISIPQAMGMMLVAKLIGPKSPDDDDEEGFATKMGKAIGRTVLFPACAIAAGALIRLWL